VAQRHFRRVSFDLIYARPDHTPESWEAELTRALAFGTGHLSYQLTIEPGTRFATLVREGRFTPLDDDAAGALFGLTRDLTARAGLPAYEISNHARPARKAATTSPTGAMAIMPASAPARTGGAAAWRQCATASRKTSSSGGRAGARLAEQRALGMAEQASEAMLMGLRLTEGVDVKALAARFGLPKATSSCPPSARSPGLGLLDDTGDRLAVTGKGMPLLDALLGELVPESLVAA
jgi:oxygen-independent coproporphyrinogen-3 oxidase